MHPNINESKQVVARVNALFDNIERFTEWESNFLYSIVNQIQQGRHMSNKQFNIINRMWNEKIPDDLKDEYPEAKYTEI